MPKKPFVDKLGDFEGSYHPAGMRHFLMTVQASAVEALLNENCPDAECWLRESLLAELCFQILGIVDIGEAIDKIKKSDVKVYHSHLVSPSRHETIMSNIIEARRNRPPEKSRRTWQRRNGNGTQ
jgi:hypothetical protein